MSVGVVWFRRDLRLQDNPALDVAVRAHERVVLVYIHAPDEEKPWQPGAASRWWLHHSLKALDADLRKRGSMLHLLVGPSSAALGTLIGQTNATAVYWNRLYEPAIMQRDERVERAMEKRGVAVNITNAALLVEPWMPTTKQGNSYQVFTPYWRNVREQLRPQPPCSAPTKIASPHIPASATIDELKLLPTITWDKGFYTHWTPGEHGAQRRFAKFLTSGIEDYREGRDRPAENWTSSLSPHLHFGEIGPRQIAWKILRSNASAGGEWFLRELGWREFSHHLLYHFPKTPERNLNRQFDTFPWARRDALSIERWQRGRTGIPMIDAGMRQLWETGWMHNRVRMLVASFLTKNLRQNWTEGARWFWDTLVDADLANNTQGWQWTAGSGADAAPYFRIFNPVTQGKRFDPEGDYVRRWIPELKSVPTKFVHEPWLDADVLAKTKYPAPMIELSASRTSALGAYQQMRRDVAKIRVEK
ncbi:MAG: deoxyribodipyrimidine photo-lyase [Rudaea sp.]